MCYLREMKGEKGKEEIHNGDSLWGDQILTKYIMFPKHFIAKALSPKHTLNTCASYSEISLHI